jgi:galactonate dehydratase
MENAMTSRRDWLSALGAGAGFTAAGLNDVLGADEVNNPAANVADRTTTIKITKLTATPVMRKVFLKIETNHGVTGWGEIDQLEPFVAATLARSLFELLDGENPTRIEHLWQKIFRAHRNLRGGPFLTHTLAGIDMALWDITGKLWGVPVYRLLGGPSREKLRFYPTPTATKIGAGPQPFSGTPQQIEEIVKNVRNARKQVGPDGIVMFDAHCALPPPFLIQLAAAIEPYDLLYMEEPAVPGNLEVFKRLKQHISIPLAVGEQARTIWEVIGYLQEGCADILEVDCAHTGGITQLRKIATLGEAYHVPIAPHCVTTDLGATASLHCSAAIPFFLIHEYYRRDS